PRTAIREHSMIDPSLAASRLSRLHAAMDRERIDVAAIVPGPNFYFLTGAHFGLMERPTVLLISRSGTWHAIIPYLEKSRWQSLAPDAETAYWRDSDGYDDAFRSIAARLSPARIGVEGQRMRFFEAEALRRAFAGSAIVDAHAAIS